MAYNPYEAVNKIYNLKGEYNNATDETRNSIATKAQAYYKQLRDNGYSDVADELASKNYEQSSTINNKYAKAGNTEYRPYMYALGENYGLSKDQINKSTSFDNDTGEVSLNGKSIGKPKSIVNGASYWDSGTLDTAFKNYVSANGITKPVTNSINQENESLFSKYNAEYDYLKNTNPLETATSKSILNRYDIKGLQAGYGAIADGGGSNGGNIDSYSANNALMQQASLRSSGEQVALLAHQQSSENTQKLLSQMGINISRVNNDYRTDVNDKVKNDVLKSQVTGTVPINMDNEYFRDDGTLKNVGVDYKAIIDSASNELATETDPQKVAGLKSTIKKANEARNYKITNIPAYQQYADTIRMYSPEETSTVKQNNNQIAAQRDIANTQAGTQRDIAGINANAQTTVAGINGNTQTTVAGINSNTQITTAGIDANARTSVASMDNASRERISSGDNASRERITNSTNTALKGVDLELARSKADKSVSGWLYSPQGYTKDTFFGEGWNKNTNNIYAARDKLNDPDAVDYIKSYLIGNGYKEAQANTWIKNAIKTNEEQTNTMLSW